MYLISITTKNLANDALLAKLSITDNVRSAISQKSHWIFGDYLIEFASSKSLPVRVRGDIYDRIYEIQLGSDKKFEPHRSPGPWINLSLNSETNNIEITRDPAGLMAAFFARIPGGYLISDSIPTLLESPNISRIVDLEALNEFWFLDFCISPRTIWTDIRAVPNGHSVHLDLTGRRKPVYAQYWLPGKASAALGPLSAETAPAALRATILEETKFAIDASAGSFSNLLSGGVDSSVVLAACHVLGYKPKEVITFKGVGDADESGLASITAKRLAVPLRLVTSEGSDLFETAREVVDIWGQPYAHGSVSAMQELLRGLPVGSSLLTGDGGGEAFAGSIKPLSTGRWLANSLFKLANSLPKISRKCLYRRLATRSDFCRAASYALEHWSAMSDAERQLCGGPITRWETEAVIAPALSGYFRKLPVSDRLEDLGDTSDLQDESLFARSLAFWWAPEGVYAKTWRLLDTAGVIGYAPLASPNFFDTVKRMPVADRGLRKHALRKAFADILPEEVLNAPKRGLRPLNRELLAAQADAGISWIANGESGAWDQLFDREAVVDYWRAHRDGKVFRSNLLYKAIVFRAWCDRWTPVIQGPVS